MASTLTSEKLIDNNDRLCWERCWDEKYLLLKVNAALLSTIKTPQPASQKPQNFFSHQSYIYFYFYRNLSPKPTKKGAHFYVKALHHSQKSQSNFLTLMIDGNFLAI